MPKLIVGVTAFLVLLSARPVDTQQTTRPPIIDVHLHAYSAANWKGAPRNPVTGKPGPASADEHMRQTLAVMAQYNIVRAIVSGPIDVVEQ